MDLAAQELCVQKEDGRWVVVPMGEFQYVETAEQELGGCCPELPGLLYEGEADSMRVQVCLQLLFQPDSRVESEWDVMWGSGGYFDTTPKPDAAFARSLYVQNLRVVHLGSPEERKTIKQVGLSVAPVFAGAERPRNLPMAVAGYNGSDSNGRVWSSQYTEKDWGPQLDLGGGGADLDAEEDVKIPQYYAAELYLNGQGAARLDLALQEGETKW